MRALARPHTRPGPTRGCLLLERAASVKSCSCGLIGQGDGTGRLTGDEEMGDRQPCLAECKEQASNALGIPERFRRIPLLVRWRRSAAPVLCAQRLLNDWLGLGWLDGPCRDDANGFTATAALCEPAADLRRGAHPHVVFRRLLLVLCHSRFASAVLLMKWNSGTNGPKAKGGRKGTPGGKVQSGPVVAACGWPPNPPCSTRLLPRDAAELVTIVV